LTIGSFSRIIPAHTEVLLLSLFLFLSAAFAALPAREGFVTDGPDLIPAEVQVSLERELAGYNERTGFDVAVLVVDTLSGQDVCEFATAVRKDWSLGGPDKNGTLYVVVPPPEKKACIATGPGARVYMSDTEATKIVEEVAKPLNLRDRRVDAIVAATDAIVTALGDTPVADRPAPPEPAQPFVDHSSSAKQEDTDAVVILLWITGAILLVIFLVWLGLMAVLAAMLSRRSPWSATRLRAASAICSRRTWVSSFSSAMMDLYCDYTFTMMLGQYSHSHPTPPCWRGER